ncbi:MAG: HEAT repeat domain-containing protein [Deltaproteobacteria bacterium]|nr:HEAT repeat domain-containing protein [Deltaproteobacteria bacterium]
MKLLSISVIFFGVIGIAAVGIGAEKAVVSQEAQDDSTASVNALIQQGSALIAEGNYKRVLDMITALPVKEKNNIQVRTLECFANLKGWLSTKDPVCKTDWWGLRMKLIYRGDTGVTPVLVTFLEDGDPYMRKYAADLLSYIGDERALDALQAVKENDDNSGVRRYARQAYKHISGDLTPMVSDLPPLTTPQAQIPVTMEVAGPIAQSNPISFDNSTQEFKIIFLTTLNYTKYYADFQAWGDIIIAQLEDELQKRGVKVVTPAGTAANRVVSAKEKVSKTQEKEIATGSYYSFNVSVQDIKLIQGSWATRCIISVLIERANGQWSNTYEGNNASPASAARAIDGAVYRVVEATIKDSSFRDAISH